MKFGEAARQLCGAASQLLGWRPDEFWDATPADFANALIPPGDAPDGPGRSVIDELRCRFPDQ
jgi:uncharacterized phage protein (TIGR02216 family)